MESFFRLVWPTDVGGDAASDFLVGTTVADTLSSPGVNVLSNSAVDISNGDSVYYDASPDTAALPRDYYIYTSDLHTGRAALLDTLSTLLSGRSTAPVSCLLYTSPSPRDS